MFARATTFQGAPDSVDGPIRFPVKRAAKGVDDLPGFLGILDLADRRSGRAMVVTLWATEEARAGSAEFARNATKKVTEESGEQVVSVHEYEVGHYIFSDSLLKT